MTFLTPISSGIARRSAATATGVCARFWRAPQKIARKKKHSIFKNVRGLITLPPEEGIPLRVPKYHDSTRAPRLTPSFFTPRHTGDEGRHGMSSRAAMFSSSPDSKYTGKAKDIGDDEIAHGELNFHRHDPQQQPLGRGDGSLSASPHHPNEMNDAESDAVSSRVADVENKEKTSPLPPGTYKTVGLLTFLQLINNLGFGSVIPVLPLFANEMGLGAAGVGFILSTSSMSRLALNIPFSRLADRIGRKPPMVVGQLMTATASVCTGLSATLPQVLACRLLLGAGSSSAMAGSTAVNSFFFYMRCFRSPLSAIFFLTAIPLW